MKQPKVSVIIPVFNTEKYIGETLDCIIGQTLPDIEIIVINDGSTDNSLQVIQKKAELDHRIIVLDQPNMGQSVARNRGIEKASGEYIYFMDSDDLLDLDTFEKCYQKCTSKQLDFVLFDADIFSENGVKPLGFNYYRARFIEDRTFGGSELFSELIQKKMYRASPCLSFINLQFFKQSGLTFHPGIIHEDELFTATLYLNAHRVGRIDQPFFKRRLREDSVMTKKFSYRNIDGYLTVIAQLVLLAKGPFIKHEKMIEQLIKYMINPAIYRCNVLPRSERNTIFQICVKNNYLKYIKPKNLMVLVFPEIIRLKAKLIKR